MLRAPERRGRRLRVPQVPVRRRGAPAPELARPAQDAQADRRRLAEDGRLRRHGDRPQGHDLRQERLAAARAPTPMASTSACASATSRSRASPTTSRCGSSARSSSMPSSEAREPRCSGREGLAVVEVLEAMQSSLDDGGRVGAAAGMSLRPDPRGPNLHVGDDVTIGDGVDVRRQRRRARRLLDRGGHGSRRQRRARQAPRARRQLDGQARSAAGPRDRRALHDLDGRDRLRGIVARRARDRRRPRRRARARHRRREQRDRARRHGRERHDASARACASRPRPT